MKSISDHLHELFTCRWSFIVFFPKLNYPSPAYEFFFNILRRFFLIPGQCLFLNGRF